MKVNFSMRSDFEPYFRNRMSNIVPNLNNSKVTAIVVTAGPYRPYGASVAWIDEEFGILSIDWYSALRVGMGNVSDQDIIDGINNDEISPEQSHINFDLKQVYKLEWEDM